MDDTTGTERKTERTTDTRFNVILVLVFVAIAAAGYVAFDRIKAELLREQVAINVAETEALAERIDRWLAVRKTEVSTLANTPVVRSMDWDQAGPFLKAKHATMPWFYIFAHISPDGSYYNSQVDFAAGQNLSDRAHFKAAMDGRVYASDPVVSRTLGTDIVAVTAPIYDRDESDASIIGVFGGMIDTSTIVKELATFENGPDSYAFALNSTGIAIAHPDEARMGNINTNAIALTGDVDPGLAQVATSMLTGEPGWTETTVDGQAVFATFVPIQEANWFVATMTDAGYVRGQIAVINYVGIFALALLVAAFAMVLRFRRLEFDAINREREISDEKNRAKSIFLANMSHELRTPLNGILGYSQILLGRPEVDDVSRKHLKTILGSGQHLLSLINRVLDLSKIEAGRLDLDRRPVDLHSMLHDLVRIFEVENGKSATTFSWSLSPDLPKIVTIDPDKVTQVITNVVVNAFKYGGTGDVRLAVNATLPLEASDGASHLRVVIEDHGIGMTPEQVERAFVPFEQASAKSEGAGLGLAIVGELVKLMEGSIDVQSTPGEGTTVTILLPLEVTEGAVVPSSSDVDALLPVGIEGGRRRVLVIDDNPTNRTYLDDLLGSVGFDVDVAEDGERGLALFASESYDLVVTDLVMPHVDGFGVITAIRAGQRSRDVPIVVASASAFPGDQVRSVAVGANVFLSKPLDPATLLGHLERLLGIRYRYDDAVAATSPTGPTIEAQTVSLDASDPAVRAILDRIDEAADMGRTAQVRRIVDEVADPVVQATLRSSLGAALDELDGDAVRAVVRRLAGE